MARGGDDVRGARRPALSAPWSDVAGRAAGRRSCGQGPQRWSPHWTAPWPPHRAQGSRRSRGARHHRRVEGVGSSSARSTRSSSPWAAGAPIPTWAPPRAGAVIMGLSPRRHRCQRLGLLNPRQTLGAKEGSVPEASGHEAEEAPLPPHGAPYQLNYCPLVAGASVELYEWTVDPAGERNLAGTRPDLAGVTPVPALRLGSQRSRADRPGLAPRGSRRAGGRVRAPEMRLRFDGRPRYRPHLHHGVDPARGGLGFLRARVLGPLVLFQAGVQPNGVRRVEQSGTCSSAPIDLALHDRESCRNAPVASVALNTDLREQRASPTLVRRTDAERAARSFLS